MAGKKESIEAAKTVKEPLHIEKVSSDELFGGVESSQSSNHADIINHINSNTGIRKEGLVKKFGEDRVNDAINDGHIMSKGGIFTATPIGGGRKDAVAPTVKTESKPVATEPEPEMVKKTVVKSAPARTHIDDLADKMLDHVKANPGIEYNVLNDAFGENANKAKMKLVNAGLIRPVLKEIKNRNGTRIGSTIVFYTPKDHPHSTSSATAKSPASTEKPLPTQTNGPKEATPEDVLSYIQKHGSVKGSDVRKDFSSGADPLASPSEHPATQVLDDLEQSGSIKRVGDKYEVSGMPLDSEPTGDILKDISEPDSNQKDEKSTARLTRGQKIRNLLHSVRYSILGMPAAEARKEASKKSASSGKQYGHVGTEDKNAKGIFNQAEQHGAVVLSPNNRDHAEAFRLLKKDGYHDAKVINKKTGEVVATYLSRDKKKASDLAHNHVNLSGLYKTVRSSTPRGKTESDIDHLKRAWREKTGERAIATKLLKEMRESLGHKDAKPAGFRLAGSRLKLQRQTTADKFANTEHLFRLPGEVEAEQKNNAGKKIVDGKRDPMAFMALVRNLFKKNEPQPIDEPDGNLNKTVPNVVQPKMSPLQESLQRQIDQAKRMSAGGRKASVFIIHHLKDPTQKPSFTVDLENHEPHSNGTHMFALHSTWEGGKPTVGKSKAEHFSKKKVADKFAGSEQRSMASVIRDLGSKQQQKLREVAGDILTQMGLPHKMADAINDTATESKPGIAQSILKPVSPEHTKEAAARYGMLTGQESLLVFHSHPDGADSMYSIDMPGGDESRKALDSAGITKRTLIPTKTGFRAIIHDPGRKMRDTVGNFATSNGLKVDESTGTGEFIGGNKPVDKPKVEQPQQMSKRESSDRFARQPKVDIGVHLNKFAGDAAESSLGSDHPSLPAFKQADHYEIAKKLARGDNDLAQDSVMHLADYMRNRKTKAEIPNPEAYSTKVQKALQTHIKYGMTTAEFKRYWLNNRYSQDPIVARDNFIKHLKIAGDKGLGIAEATGKLQLRSHQLRMLAQQLENEGTIKSKDYWSTRGGSRRWYHSSVENPESPPLGSMAQPKSKMEVIQKIKELLGTMQRKDVAKQVGISPRTMRKYIATEGLGEIRKQAPNGQGPPRKSRAVEKNKQEIAE